MALYMTVSTAAGNLADEGHENEPTLGGGRGFAIDAGVKKEKISASFFDHQLSTFNHQQKCPRNRKKSLKKS
jgi:hypothetical protein